MNFIGKL
jgi:hypothetical protein